MENMQDFQTFLHWYELHSNYTALLFSTTGIWITWWLRGNLASETLLPHTVKSMTLTRHMQLSSSNDKLSGFGLVGSADIYASMVTPSVPDHQVCCEDDHFSGNGLSIWLKKNATKNNRGQSQMILTKKKRDWPWENLIWDRFSGFQLPEKQHKGKGEK